MPFLCWMRLCIYECERLIHTSARSTAKLNAKEKDDGQQRLTRTRLELGTKYHVPRAKDGHNDITRSSASVPSGNLNTNDHGQDQSPRSHSHPRVRRAASDLALLSPLSSASIALVSPISLSIPTLHRDGDPPSHSGYISAPCTYRALGNCFPRRSSCRLGSRSMGSAVRERSLKMASRVVA